MILFYFIFPPHGDIRPCGLAPSRRYSALRPRPLTEIDFLFASRRNRFSIRLTAKSIFYSASRRMSIYFSLAASRRNRFSIRLTANVDFIFLTPPHGEIDFLFASRRNRFPIRLTANVDFIFLTPPHGEIDFLFASRRNRFSIQPHGEC